MPADARLLSDAITEAVGRARRGPRDLSNRMNSHRGSQRIAGHVLTRLTHAAAPAAVAVAVADGDFPAAALRLELRSEKKLPLASQLLWCLSSRLF